MGQNGNVADNQRDTRSFGGGLEISRPLATESNNWQVFGGLSLLQPRDRGANIVPRAFEIH